MLFVFKFEGSRKRDDMQKPITIDCGKIDYLRRCASLLVDWKYQKRAGFTVATFNACIQTFNGLADLAEHLLRTHNFSFVLLGKTYEIL